MMTNKREGCERRILDIRVKLQRRRLTRRVEDRRKRQRHMIYAIAGLVLSFLNFLYFFTR